MARYRHALLVHYATDYYAPEHERCIIWNDPDLGIAWPDAEHFN